MYLKLLGIIILLALCFPLATAAPEYVGTIHPTLTTSQILNAGGLDTAVSKDIGNYSIRWRTNFAAVSAPASMYMAFPNDAYAQGTTTFQLRDVTGVYATGTAQFGNGTAIYGTNKQYIYLDFSSWDPGTRTGVISGNLSIPDSNTITKTDVFGSNIFNGLHATAGSGSMPMGPTVGAMLTDIGAAGGGSFYNPEPYVIDVDFIAEKQSGSGATQVTKIDIDYGTDNTVSSSILTINNATKLPTYISPFGGRTGTETFYTTGDNFYIQVYSSFLSGYYNSSVLYETGYVPTPTPTPTGTPVPSVPTGATRTTIFATDGSTGSKIVGASLAVRDVQNGTWANTTSSLAGSVVDVLSSHTLDIYGSYPGTYTASSELGVTPGGNYYLPLMPPIPTQPIGYVNVIINVQDSDTHLIVPSAAVSFRLPTGATTVESTGVWGTAQTVQPNNTVIIVGVSKSGYQSLSISLNSGTGADVIRTLQLTKNTVATPAPVVTDPGTGAVITAVPTILPGCGDPNSDECMRSKDSSMMAQLRDNGPMIVDLAIYAVLIGLMGMILSGVMKWGK